MQKIKLDVDELDVESFEPIPEQIRQEGTVEGYFTELETCSCVDCRTATAGRCCPP